MVWPVKWPCSEVDRGTKIKASGFNSIRLQSRLRFHWRCL